MRNQHNDLEYLMAAAADLQQYLLSPHLFWTLSGPRGAALQGDSDQLTPGNLVLTLRRLKTAPMSEEDFRVYSVLRVSVDQTLNQWQANWIKKAAQDFTKRLDLWSDYLHALHKSPQDHRSDYAFNVRNRVILELLLEIIPEPEESVRQYLAALDSRLAGRVKSVDFIWEETIQAAFPADRYPYLYQIPAAA